MESLYIVAPHQFSLEDSQFSSEASNSIGNIVVSAHTNKSAIINHFNKSEAVLELSSSSHENVLRDIVVCRDCHKDVCVSVEKLYNREVSQLSLLNKSFVQLTDSVMKFSGDAYADELRELMCRVSNTNATIMELDQKHLSFCSSNILDRLCEDVNHNLELIQHFDARIQYDGIGSIQETVWCLYSSLFQMRDEVSFLRRPVHNFCYASILFHIYIPSRCDLEPYSFPVSSSTISDLNYLWRLHQFSQLTALVNGSYRLLYCPWLYNLAVMEHNQHDRKEQRVSSPTGEIDPGVNASTNALFVPLQWDEINSGWAVLGTAICSIINQHPQLSGNGQGSWCVYSIRLSRYRLFLCRTDKVLPALCLEGGRKRQFGITISRYHERWRKVQNPTGRRNYGVPLKRSCGEEEEDEDMIIIGDSEHLLDGEVPAWIGEALGLADPENCEYDEYDESIVTLAMILVSIVLYIGSVAGNAVLVGYLAEMCDDVLSLVEREMMGSNCPALSASTFLRSRQLPEPIFASVVLKYLSSLVIESDNVIGRSIDRRKIDGVCMHLLVFDICATVNNVLLGHLQV